MVGGARRHPFLSSPLVIKLGPDGVSRAVPPFLDPYSTFHELQNQGPRLPCSCCKPQSKQEAGKAYWISISFGALNLHTKILHSGRISLHLLWHSSPPPHQHLPSTALRFLFEDSATWWGIAVSIVRFPVAPSTSSSNITVLIWLRQTEHPRNRVYLGAQWNNKNGLQHHASSLSTSFRHAIIHRKLGTRWERGTVPPLLLT